MYFFSDDRIMTSDPKLVKKAILLQEWDGEREKEIKLIATHGVLQFFNAVSKARRELRKRVKKASTVSKDKQIRKESKKKFLKKMQGKALDDCEINNKEVDDNNEKNL